jgi:hypothetical protein
MPRRFQFSLRTLLIPMFGVACFLGGRSIERTRYKLESTEFNGFAYASHPAGTERIKRIEELHMPDGTVWRRFVDSPRDDER